MIIRNTIGTVAVAACLVALAAAPARAEFDVSGFVGAHFFAADNELGRYINGPDDLAPQHGVMLGFRLGWFPWERLGLEGELAYNPTYVRGGTQSFEHILHYRAHARFNVLTGRIRPFVVLGGGQASMWTDKQKYVLNDNDPYLHLGLGLEYDISKDWGVRLDWRMLFVPAVHDTPWTEDYEVLIGFYGRFDRKGPSAAADRDHDGVPDAIDRCPDKPGPRENQGCPDTDRDGDSIVDRLDKCPDEPGIPENDGCPEKDSDGDGLLDRSDRCPLLPGPWDNQGCPDLDRDGDGIVDRLDKCPDDPETRNAYEDEDGCPDEIPIEVKQFTGVIRGINFQTASSEIRPDSFPLLDEAAKVLTEHPEVKIEISGHTDSVGGMEYNVRLSEARANSVRDYFIQKGIDPVRLKAIGFGPAHPIDTNDTDAGRAKNRRVEFTLFSEP